ncbi:YbaK/EbsC family protein [Azoarcus sp. DN11]|uniref:aminoacyl-tRNA deacylase n=1 Tax=Azoarcus sp. DN11 TaxID=356837 RepID=UPI000EB3AF00|nr:YbaK/EbsC family protein [Azoarcus sp. DN11]AYH44260.1 aminoacyl-tRNA deacylase [Azoarcus sp. DN11]
MAIPSKVNEFMMEHGLRYDVLAHPHSRNSLDTAHLARVPAGSLAKSVVLEDDHGYLMAVLPSTQHVQLGILSKAMHRELRLASEPELSRLFTDCEAGAVPPLGAVYGMRMIVEENLADQDEIYFESGDHEKIIQMSRSDFMTMMEMENAQRLHFSGRQWHH